jgi:hypothetical protein
MCGVLLPEIAWLSCISLRNALWRHQLHWHVGTVCSTPNSWWQCDLSARWCSCALCQHCYGISCWDISTAVDWEGRMEAMAPTLSGPDTPGFLFLGVCIANCLQCSHSRESTLETANQGSCWICHSWCSWSSVAGNGILLRSLQSHQWSPHRTSINTWEKLFEFFNLIHV